MNGQIEREYREALDGLRFSSEAKARMAEKLVAGQDAGPVKGKCLRPLRAGLIAAAACALLAGTAGAATLIAQQANVNFFDSWEEYFEAQRAKSEKDGVDYGVSAIFDDLLDYGELEPMDMDYWWNGEQGGEQEEESKYIFSTDDGVIVEDAPSGDEAGDFRIGEAHIQYDQGGQTLLDETVGAAEDGWTARRLFRDDRTGQDLLVAKYRAEALSGFDGLWDGWNTAWLEEHYTTAADRAMFEHVEADGEPLRYLTIGEFRGQGDTVFNLQYSWDTRFAIEEENRITTNLDHIETYTTADGVKVTIQTAASHTGKTLFWADFHSGHGSFGMFGTQVELDELHTILDSLNLSNLLEYVPAE